LYLLVSGLILGASIYTQANLLFWAFGLMIGGLGVSAAMSWRALRGVEVQRLLPGHGVAGEMLVLRYQLRNRSWLPLFGLLVQETWGRGVNGWKRVGPVAERPAVLLAPPRGWVLHLGPNQSCQAEAPCWPTRRGALDFEQIVISTSFPFNVIRKTVIVRQAQQVLVYPHLYRVNRRLISRLATVEVSGRHQTDRRGGHDEFYGLRDYRPGDSLKMIDWRRSARTGELVAREMTKPSPPRMMVLLDLSHRLPGVEPAERRVRRGRAGSPEALTPQQAIEEQAIALAASLVCDGYLHGFQVGLAVKGPPSPVYMPHHSLPHRARLFEALARLVPARRDQKAPPPTVEPSVVITTVPSAGEAGGGVDRRRGAAVLHAAKLDDYVRAGDPSVLLSSRVRSISRREELANRQASGALADPTGGAA
jgi:uncharacterized protein (DUF58 family)